MKRFSQHLKESQESHVVLTYGRMNPPSLGHEKLIKKVHEIANLYDAPHHVILSYIVDHNTNPLDPDTKLKYAQQFFPDTNIELATKVHYGIIQQAERIKGNHTHLHVIAGSDKIQEYETLLNRYNGKDYESITVHSAGNRNQTNEGIEGLSATKLRQYAAEGNKVAFDYGLPSKAKGSNIYDAVRKGLGLVEEIGQALFLVGGPGSGKDIILRPFLSYVNEITPNQLQQDRIQPMLQTHTPIIINGTWPDCDSIEAAKTYLTERGYETAMVYVYVSDEESRKRNQARQHGGRVINENLRYEKWYQNNNLFPFYKALFENRFVVFDNDEKPILEPVLGEIQSLFGSVPEKCNDLDTKLQQLFMTELFGQGYPIVPDDAVKEKDIDWSDVVRARKKKKPIGSVTTSVSAKNSVAGTGVGDTYTSRGDGSSFPMGGLGDPSYREEVDSVMPNFGDSGSSHSEPMTTPGERSGSGSSTGADDPATVNNKKKKPFKSFRKGDLGKRTIG